ncbi:MAG: hypothetical protein ACLUE1_05240 [Adlercreutzia equolifaciens]
MLTARVRVINRIVSEKLGHSINIGVGITSGVVVTKIGVAIPTMSRLLAIALTSLQVRKQSATKYLFRKGEERVAIKQKWKDKFCSFSRGGACVLESGN